MTRNYGTIHLHGKLFVYPLVIIKNINFIYVCIDTSPSLSFSLSLCLLFVMCLKEKESSLEKV